MDQENVRVPQPHQSSATCSLTPLLFCSPLGSSPTLFFQIGKDIVDWEGVAWHANGMQESMNGWPIL